MKGIILKKDEKARFDEIGPEGEMVYATNTKEVGIRTNAGTLVWNNWDRYPIIHLVETEFNEQMPLAHGGKRITVDQGVIKEEIKLPDNTFREIKWGLTLNEANALYEPNYHNALDFPFVGQFTNRMADGYVPVRDDQIATQGYLNDSNNIKLDGTSRISPDYGANTPRTILSLDWLQNNVWKLPDYDPGEGIMWSPDGINIELGSTIKFEVHITSLYAPVVTYTSGGSITITKLTNNFYPSNNDYTLTSEDKISHFRLKSADWVWSVAVIRGGTLSSLQGTFTNNTMQHFSWNGPCNATNFNGTWQGCRKITSFPLIDTSKGTNFGLTWLNCVGLTSFPLIDISSTTDLSAAWLGCSGLLTFPLLDTSLVEDFGGAWDGCSSLTSFPAIDTSSATVISGTWTRCSGLTSFPFIDTSNVTTFQSAWYGCSSLTSFPFINTSSGTEFSGAWYGCSSLTSFPTLDTSSGTALGSTWGNCSGLTSFPALATSNVTSFQNTWSGCSGLTSFPFIDTSSGTVFGSTWYGCTSLICMGGLDTTNSISLPSNIFSNSLNIVRPNEAERTILEQRGVWVTDVPEGEDCDSQSLTTVYDVVDGDEYRWDKGYSIMDQTFGSATKISGDFVLKHFATDGGETTGPTIITFTGDLLSLGTSMKIYMNGALLIEMIFSESSQYQYRGNDDETWFIGDYGVSDPMASLQGLMNGTNGLRRFTFEIIE